jgi:ubiquinone/menaquinone biosynthesis C-methylase UbiE
VSIGDKYVDTVARHLRPGATVVDVGGGKRCSYGARRPSEGSVRIIAVDLSEESMEGNTDVDERRVADVVRAGLPFGAEEVDLVTSRSVLEHLQDVERFAAESARVLKPGGHSIHLLPGRFGLFALINAVLPHRVARALLFSLRPSMIGIGGYPVRYDRCSYRELKDVFERQGHDVHVEPSYFGAQYFEFLFPLFAAVSAYEWACRALGLKQLAPRLLVVARKR